SDSPCSSKTQGEHTLASGRPSFSFGRRRIENQESIVLRPRCSRGRHQTRRSHACEAAFRCCRKSRRDSHQLFDSEQDAQKVEAAMKLLETALCAQCAPTPAPLAPSVIN